MTARYPQLPAGRGPSETISACGAPNDLHYDEDAVVTACGAPNHLHMTRMRRRGAGGRRPPIRRCRTRPSPRRRVEAC